MVVGKQPLSVRQPPGVISPEWLLPAERIRSHSYFEGEADKEFQLPLALPEDAIWNMVRLAPAALPQGEFVVIP